MNMLGKAFIIIVCLICACWMRLEDQDQFSTILLCCAVGVALIPAKYER